MVANKRPLLSFEEAQALVLQHAPRLPVEPVAIAEALGRVGSGTAVSLCDLPPFDNAAVDGYAIARGDVAAATMRDFIIGDPIKAGAGPSTIEPGFAVRIFTGAMIPEGTGAIVMQEQATVIGDRVRFESPIQAGDHIRRRASELAVGEQLPCRGVVSPAVIGMLAAAGVETLEVSKRPRVAIIVTGDELVPRGSGLLPGQIYESNGAALHAAAIGMGAEVAFIEHVRDEYADLREACERALATADVLLTSGGVSVGDHDLVRPVLAELGVEEHFWGVAMKPGKPICFGSLGACTVFGLPGNPVSALIGFALFVRPHLLARQGIVRRPELRTARLSHELTKKPGRTEFVPAHWEGGAVVPFVGRASHKTTCLAEANALIVMPAEASRIEAGESVEIHPLAWGSER